MSSRALLLLAVLAAATVGAVVWLDRTGPADEGVAEAERLVPLAWESVRTVEVARPDVTIRVERNEEGGWNLVSPERGEADPRQARAVARAIEEARVHRVLDGADPRDPQYGLAPAAANVRIESSDGKVASIAVGRPSPVGSRRYLSVGGGPVLLGEIQVPGILDHGLERFRERRLIPVEPDQIVRIEIHRPEGRLLLEREGPVWRLTEPIADVADLQEADALVRLLASLSLDPVRSAEDARVLGAGDAEFRVATEVKGPRRTFWAAIGPERPGRGREASRVDPLLAGVLEGGDLSSLGRRVDAWRDRTPAPFTSAEVRGIRFRGGSADVLLSRREAAGIWELSDRSHPAGPADASRADEIVERLRWLRARSVSDAGPGRFRAEWTIDLVGESGGLGTLEMGRAEESGADANGSPAVPVRSSWRPGAEFLVPADQIGVLPTSASELRARADEPLAEGEAPGP